ncbi:hypothetical protein [uncultured Helicobacter sp.]|uniref:hypothetical protein n=1 Tax=uncultured Helicobacter sp. TaxID=175537 RepID=UPI002620AE16|nr:hypothetical protein [uncultured Helicobacter sp.]
MAFVFIIGLFSLGVWIGFGTTFALNFIFAFLSFGLIVSIVFYIQKHKIQSLIKNATKEELEALAQFYRSKQEIAEEELREEESKDLHNLSEAMEIDKAESQKKPKRSKRKIWKNFSTINVKTGAKMFFLPLRLFAYGFLVIGILTLIKQQSFNALAFFSGLIVANLLIILMACLRNLKSH